MGGFTPKFKNRVLEIGAHVQGEAVFRVAVGVAATGPLQVHLQERIEAAVAQPDAVDAGGVFQHQFRVGGEDGVAQGEAVGQLGIQPTDGAVVADGQVTIPGEGAELIQLCAGDAEGGLQAEAQAFSIPPGRRQEEVAAMPHSRWSSPPRNTRGSTVADTLPSV